MNIMMAVFRNLAGVSGGLERVLCDFSNEFTRRGHHVSIVYDSKFSEKPYYPLDDTVSYINLASWKYMPKISLEQKFTREIARLRGQSALEDWQEHRRDPIIIPLFQNVLNRIRPDVIIVYEFNTNGFVYRADPSCPVVTMLHNSPSYIFPKTSKGEMMGMRHSAAVQVLVPGFIEDVKKLMPRTPVCVIPNVIPQVTVPVDLSRVKKKYGIINVARLNKESKRQHLLIEAFALLSDDFPDWNVYIWGKDKEKYEAELHHLISAKHLNNRVFLMGTTENIMAEYKKADIFALPSSHEGFGLALGEAMSSGLPAVAFRNCPAVNEIIEDGKAGYLVSDGVESFAQGLKKLMENPSLRAEMGLYAHESMKKYDSAKIWDSWEQLLKKVTRL